jgi:outer membrane protein assembly factor BamB
MVFAISNGESTKQVDNGGRIMTSKERLDARVGNAVLYALDATTGKELFSSGTTIAGVTHFSAPVVCDGRVYVTTLDNIIYAFGLGRQ